MAIDNSFLIRSISQMKDLSAAFCESTRMPFLYTDPETFSDQVWLFCDDDSFQKFQEQLAPQKIKLQKTIISKASFNAFFATLPLLGVEEIVLSKDGGKTVIPISQIVKRKDMSAIPAAKRPLENPQLQLTNLYLMQEVKRQVPNDQKPTLPALHEEFLVNLARARFLMAVRLNEGSGTPQEKLAKNEISFVNITMKNKDVFRPIFADFNEFAKFNGKNGFLPLTVPFVMLKHYLPENVKAYFLNPNGSQTVLNRQLIDQVLKSFPEEVKAGAEETRKLFGMPAQPSVAPAVKNAKITRMPGTEPET